jgi:hypothetical protein
MKLQDEMVSYRDVENSEGRCRLRVYRGDAGAVLVIATELPDNPGTPVTKVAEDLATSVYHQEGVADPEHFTWIEHYPDNPSFGEIYDLVTFDYDADRRRLTNPEWQHLEKAHVERLAGEAV